MSLSPLGAGLTGRGLVGFPEVPAPSVFSPFEVVDDDEVWPACVPLSDWSAQAVP
ncbi:hypothetical protein [Mycolicibacterium sp. CBMA 361]|uniref:hypothetical protein n=1 Tax=Mycolicibacterium sp. CBMA 361 TaxID=2606610 RepID=UPI0031BB11D2